MRQILVDYARNSRAIKRGGGAFKLRLDAVDGFPKTRDEDLLRLDDALKNLQEMDAQQNRSCRTFSTFACGQRLRRRDRGKRG